MLKYIPGMVGAIAAMTMFRLFTMFELSLRFLIFFAVYLIVTIAIDKAMARYGRQ